MSNSEKATDIIGREIYVSAFTMQWLQVQSGVTTSDKEAYAEEIRQGWINDRVPGVIKFDFREIALPITNLLKAEDLLVTDDEDLENWERPSWL